MSFFTDFLNLLFPPLCLSCTNRLIAGEEYICLSCLAKLPKTGYHNVKDNKLEMLMAGRFPFMRIASFSHFVKGGTIQPIIHELKYRNNPNLGIYMGKLCAIDIAGSDFIKSIDTLVPIPLHPNRLRQRGYNQSEMIAIGMDSVLNIPVSKDNLIRIKDNKSQTKESKEDRMSNTEGIFDVTSPELFEGKHVLLIDDIITTGSTIESCANVIFNKCSNVKISVYSFGVAF